MSWFFASALAQTGGTVDSAEIQRMVDDLGPKVAAHLGRPSIGPLQAGILGREQVRAAIDAPAPSVGTPRSTESRLAADHVRDGVAQDVRLAVYVGQTRGVWVVQEALQELFAEEGMEPVHLRPVLRCLLIHELVHGFQHAYGAVPTDVDTDRLDGWNALREGHATQVELELCAAWEGPEIVRRVVSLHGMDAPGTLAPSAPAAPYAWGRVFVELLHREDPELVWTALAAPPPPWSDLVRDLQPILGGGWQDPAPVAMALRAKDGTPVIRSSGLQPLGRLLGDRGGFGLPVVSAGWIVETPTRVVAVFRIPEPGVAEALVTRRSERTKGSGAFLLSGGPLEGDLEMDRGTMPRLEVRDDIGRSLRLDLSTKAGLGGYHERWVSTEHVLALMVTRRRAAGGDDDALDTLLDTLPAGPPTEVTTADLPALDGWLADVRARRDDLELTTGPQWRLLEAAIAWQRGDRAPCAAAFGDVLVPGALRFPETHAAQAYLCAGAADETATADRAAALLGALPPLPAAIHARSLVEAGRLEEALAILDRATTDDAAVRRALTDTRLHALGAARRWDELLALASGPEGSPTMRVQVAVVLGQLGRTAEATQLFAEACVAGDGPPPAACAVPLEMGR